MRKFCFLINVVTYFSRKTLCSKGNFTINLQIKLKSSNAVINFNKTKIKVLEKVMNLQIKYQIEHLK